MIELPQKNTLVTSVEHYKKRLDAFLAHSEEFFLLIGTKISRAHITACLKNGGAHIRGIPARPQHTLSVGEVIEIFPEKFLLEKETLLPESHLPITIIDDQPEFLVIEKPAGIQTHPSAIRKTNTVVNWVLAHFPELHNIGDNNERPGIVHRLDRDTSGLLIIAKTEKSFVYFKELFHHHAVEKHYLALIYDTMNQSEGTIEVPIARSLRGDRQVAVQDGRHTRGKTRPAITRYHVLQNFKETTLIKAIPKTGRTHQIRVHMASIGHPIVGDQLYASKASRAFSPLPSRQLLHATKLSFPYDDIFYTYNSPLPQDFRDFLETSCVPISLSPNGE